MRAEAQIIEIMRHVQWCIFLAITLPIATLVMVPSWAGPAADKALWDAAGCRGHLDTEAVKAALKLGADSSAPSQTARRRALFAAEYGSDIQLRFVPANISQAKQLTPRNLRRRLKTNAPSRPCR